MLISVAESDQVIPDGIDCWSFVRSSVDDEVIFKVDDGLPVSYEDIKVKPLLDKPIAADLRVPGNQKKDDLKYWVLIILLGMLLSDLRIPYD